MAAQFSHLESYMSFFRPLFVLLLSSSIAQASVVDLVWDNKQSFSHTVDIAPKTFLEVCGPLKLQAAVHWQFSASHELDFNIHYHVGKEAVYPSLQKHIKQSSGLLPVSLAQDYCWMWTNTGNVDVQIKVTLKLA
jgi:hypothetical protein